MATCVCGEWSKKTGKYGWTKWLLRQWRFETDKESSSFVCLFVRSSSFLCSSLLCLHFYVDSSIPQEWLGWGFFQSMCACVRRWHEYFFPDCTFTYPILSLSLYLQLLLVEVRGSGIWRLDARFVENLPPCVAKEMMPFFAGHVTWACTAITLLWLGIYARCYAAHATLHRGSGPLGEAPFLSHVCAQSVRPGFGMLS
jgi:hypothetical protein